jgi:gamma-glutamyl phosphate reductase
MTKVAVVDYIEYSLPASVVSKVDVARLVHEAEQVDSEINAAKLRAKSHLLTHSKPAISDQLHDFLDQNKLSLNTSKERTSLIKQLRLLKDKAPVIHMTFATIADRESLEHLVQWLRTSVHAHAVISVGVQPNLIGGVYVRTPNHVHDFSLRGMLNGQHEVLLAQLRALKKEKKHV